MTTPVPPPAPYRPAREKVPRPAGEDLEVDLVHQVVACGTCEFFWPDDPAAQPYGPYPSFDMRLDPPPPKDPPATTASFPWIEATTAPPSFPTPEILDGCRKAPIMTIGINPNLTAFAPGQAGASWCYPNFGDDETADLWTKYAYYYRYRSVFQERFDLSFVTRFLVPGSEVVAPRDGVVVSADRPTDAPGFRLRLRYDGDLVDTVVPLDRPLGTPRWVVLFDTHGPTARFSAGDVVAARLDVPAGQPVRVTRQQVGYYEQFVPVLEAFQDVVRASGHPDAELRMGEDVCQLDMVATASPHWNPGFLGGTRESEQTIVDNCVARNAFAMQQLVQTRPAVLYLVGEATWNMFHRSFGAHVERDAPISSRPADGAFTLLRETTDPAHPSWFRVRTSVDGRPYELSTRLVVTPHFSYSANFTPQVRLAPAAWRDLQAADPACAAFLRSDPRVVLVPPVAEDDYVAFVLDPQDAAAVLADVEARHPGSAAAVTAGFYDPHRMMAGVLAALYQDGVLSYGLAGPGGLAALRRTEGSCRFCVNERWQFPGECRYGKPDEERPPPGYLEAVARLVVATGRPGARR